MRERLEALGEELKSAIGNRPVTLATVRKHQLVEATVTQLLWCRDSAEIKELVIERSIPVCGPDGKAKVKEAFIRDLPVDVTIGSAQSKVFSWRRRLAPTGETSPWLQRAEHADDISGSFGILEEGNDPPSPVSNVGTAGHSSS